MGNDPFAKVRCEHGIRPPSQCHDCDEAMTTPNIPEQSRDGLLACPWCNGTDIDAKTRRSEYEGRAVFQAYHECHDCGAQGPATAWYNDSPHDGDGSGALHWLKVHLNEDGWNTRALTPEQLSPLSDGLLAALEEARQFIESEYRDPAAEEHGEWLAKEARSIHAQICNALSRPSLEPSDAMIERVAALKVRECDAMCEEEIGWNGGIDAAITAIQEGADNGKSR